MIRWFFLIVIFIRILIQTINNNNNNYVNNRTTVIRYINTEANVMYYDIIWATILYR